MEKDVGIEVYATSTQELGGRIKTFPEDFVVEEIPFLPPREEGGGLTVVWVKSKNWETNRLVRAMARNLHISRKRIRFAGTKDKRAVTTQLFQFDASEDVVARLRLKDVEVLESYGTSKPIDIGSLRGNRFEVTVRGTGLSGEEASTNVSNTLEQLTHVGGFPNFFGVQRFGSIRPITHVVGQHIIRGDFKAAIDAYAANPIEGEGEEEFQARTQLERDGDYAAALKAYPDVMTFEKAILNYLVKHPDDYVGALEELPFNLLLMFVHGYQSFLFNRMVSERVRQGLPLNSPLEGDVLMPIDNDGLPDENRFIPVTSDNAKKAGKQVADGKAVVTAVLFGSESEFAGGEMGEIERKVVESEVLRQVDFTIPRMPRLSSRGTRRAVIVPMPTMETTYSDDCVKMRFKLPRGSYATVLLREILKVDPLEG